MSKYSVTIADLKKDKEDILALWKRNFNGLPEERYSWIYEGNPSGYATCFLARETKKDSVVGSAALFPRKIIIAGKYFMSGIAGDISIDRDHRGFGPILLLQKATISNFNKGNFDILYEIADTKQEPFFRRMGCKVVGEVFRLTKPLRSHYHLKKYISFPIVTKIVSTSVDFFMKYLSKESYYKDADGCYFEILSRFDKRFDDLWESASNGFTVIGERSSCYLNWRYCQSPNNNYRIFALIQKKSGDILGYIVYHTTKKMSYIDDLFSININGVLDSLISEFLLFQRKKRINSVSISYFGNQLLLKKLKEYGFSIRQKRGKLFIYISPDFPFLTFLLDTENWYLLSGDSDL